MKKLDLFLIVLFSLFTIQSFSQGKWAKIQNVTTTQNLYSVTFYPAPYNNHGIAVGSQVVSGYDYNITKNGIIYFTTDGGCTWDTAYLFKNISLFS